MQRVICHSPFGATTAVVLDPIAKTVAQGRKIAAPEGDADAAWWIREGREGHLISFYPIVVPVIIAPLYLPAVDYLEARGWDPLLLDHVAEKSWKSSSRRCSRRRQSCFFTS